MLGGFFLTVILLSPQGLIAQVAVADQFGGAGPSIDVPYEFLKIYLNLLGSLSMFVLPILSMGLYAEERKQGTLELLATSPITNWAVALGKLLGVVSFYIAILLPLMFCEAIALSASDPPHSAPGHDSGAYRTDSTGLSYFVPGHVCLLLDRKHRFSRYHDFCPGAFALGD